MRQMKVNPLDPNTMQWLKFVEALHRDIPMDALQDAVGKAITEEMEPNETRDEQLNRIFGEALKRSEG